MYFRVKRTGAYAYLQIVESFREKGQVHQRVLSTVGRLDALQATGQLDKLMRSGLRFCEKLAVIDAHAAGQTQAVQMQRVGPDLVFGRLWEALQLGAIIERALQSRRFEFDVERAVYLTVLHRVPSVDVRNVENLRNSAKSAWRGALAEDEPAGGARISRSRKEPGPPCSSKAANVRRPWQLPDCAPARL